MLKKRSLVDPTMRDTKDNAVAQAWSRLVWTIRKLHIQMTMLDPMGAYVKRLVSRRRQRTSSGPVGTLQNVVWIDFSAWQRIPNPFLGVSVVTSKKGSSDEDQTNGGEESGNKQLLKSSQEAATNT